MNEEFRRWWAQNHPTERAAVEISETYRAAQDGWRKTPTYHEVRDIIAKHVAAASSPAPASPQQQFVSEVDQWTHDLATAGWIAEAAFNWRAPDGSLWRGPAGAWKELQRRSAPGPEGEQEKCPACGEVNCFDHTLRTTTPPDTPSAAAMRAAEEISSTFGLKFQHDSLHRTAAIIMRNLAAKSETAVGGEVQKINEDGELTSTCKHCGEPISQTKSTGSWYHDSGWSRMCTKLNAAPVNATGDDKPKVVRSKDVLDAIDKTFNELGRHKMPANQAGLAVYQGLAQVQEFHAEGLTEVNAAALRSEEGS